VARTKVISVNLSEDDLKTNRRPNLGVLADPCSFLCSLAGALGQSTVASDWLDELRGRDDARNAEIAAMAAAQTEYLNPLRLCQAIDRQLSDDSILIGDGGDFIGTASYVVSPRGPYSWLDPGVFGTLGVGAGFAMGAKLTNPSADVWLLYGDGAAGFSIMEFDTFARHGIPVIAVVGNDAGWTQIERDQVDTFNDDVGCRLTHMDYHLVAKGCGAEGLLVSEESELDATLAKALEISRSGKPVLVNALIGKTDFRKGSISI
jgi:acetolactate synthase-like protein